MQELFNLTNRSCKCYLMNARIAMLKTVQSKKKDVAAND